MFFGCGVVSDTGLWPYCLELLLQQLLIKLLLVYEISVYEYILLDQNVSSLFLKQFSVQVTTSSDLLCHVDNF